METEILSNIRAIAGVTRIKIHETDRKSHYYMTRATLKIDTFPYGTTPLKQILQAIRASVLKIRGVRRFTYLSKPEKIM